MIADWTTLEGVPLVVTVALMVVGSVAGLLYGRKLRREGREPWWRR